MEGKENTNVSELSYQEQWGRVNEVLDWLKSRRIDPTPEMYDLWFNYFSNSEIKQCVDDCCRDEKISINVLDADFCSFLYYRFICKDPLTGIANRKAIAPVISREFRKSKAAGYPICLLMIDIDDFKSINDLHGHLTGDFVLQNLASILKSELRKGDFIARYGGEEFTVLLSNTDSDTAKSLASTLCNKVKSTSSLISGVEFEIDFTISVGIAMYLKNEFPIELVARADRALLFAKQQGKNRTCFV